ncbi:MAG TPA: ChrR family anti-sigma-E factor [Haliangium sp.]|nr:ChrR family anti-sigma-E factor [Haliangium sp.]
MPEHHAPDEILIAYAAGSLGASESLLVACHLTLCPRCRHLVADAEAVGAALLAAPAPAPAPAPASAPGLDAMLARLDQEAEEGEDTAGAPATAAPAARPAAVDPRGIVPAPLFRLIGDVDSAPWRRLLRGIYSLDVPAPGDDKYVKLFRFEAGLRVPRHAHPGFEGTLVLSGGFTDDDGHHVRGDLSVLDETRPHEQHIDEDGPCTWLLVADGAPIPRTLLGWIARLVLRA